MADETAGQATGSRAGLGLAVVSVATLFFIWAFVTNLIDPLVGGIDGRGMFESLAAFRQAA